MPKQTTTTDQPVNAVPVDQPINDQPVDTVVPDQVDASADQPMDQAAFEGSNFDDPAVPDAPAFLDLDQADVATELMPARTRIVGACTGAEVSYSQAGNIMISLRVQVQQVIDTSAPHMVAQYFIKRVIRERLMFIPPNPATGSRGTLWKAKQAFEAFGLQWGGRFATEREFHDWIAMSADQFVGAVAECIIGIDQSDQRNPETGELYPPRNNIMTYRPYDGGHVAAAQYRPTHNTPMPIGSDDDLPF